MWQHVAKFGFTGNKINPNTYAFFRFSFGLHSTDDKSSCLILRSLFPRSETKETENETFLDTPPDQCVGTKRTYHMENDK